MKRHGHESHCNAKNVKNPLALVSIATNEFHGGVSALVTPSCSPANYQINFDMRYQECGSSIRGRPLIIWGGGVVQIFAKDFFF